MNRLPALAARTLLLAMCVQCDCAQAPARLARPRPRRAPPRRRAPGSGRIKGGSVQAHPTRPGCFFYAVSSGLVCVCDGDPTHQAQLRGHDGEVTAFALSVGGGRAIQLADPAAAPFLTGGSPR
jgi:hypothetical protein